MGKYTSPEIIKVNPLAGLAQSVGKGLDQVASNMRAENTLKAKQAAANAKNQKDLLKEAKAKRKEVEGFRGDLLNLDVPQITGWTDKYRAAVNKEIDERLMPLQYGSDDWYAEVSRIKKYINKSDNMIKYVSDNRKKWETAHEQKNGQWVMKKGSEGSRLNLDDPEEIAVWDILDNWYLHEGDRIDFSFGSDGGAVGIKLDNSADNMVDVLDANNQQVIDPNTGKPKQRSLVKGESGFVENKELNFGAVLVNEDLGMDMINTANANQAREIRDGAANTLFGPQYKANATKMIETLQSGNKVSRTEYVKFEQANENVKTDIALNLDSYIPENKVQAQNLFQTGLPMAVTYDVWYDKPTYGLTSDPEKRITVAEYNNLSDADKLKYGSKEAAGYFPETRTVDTKTETFDRNNPAHRACYLENYQNNIIKENEIYNTAKEEIEKLSVKPGFEDIARFDTEGMDMSFGDGLVEAIAVQRNLGNSVYLNTVVDGRPVKEYLEEGKITPLVITSMAEEFSRYRDENTILFAKTIMQNNPANKNYSFFTGVEEKTNLVNKYTAAFMKAVNPLQNNIAVNETNILKFAAGHWPNPDPATNVDNPWVVPSNPALWARPDYNEAKSIFNKADDIQDNVLYKIGGSSMKAVYDIDQLKSAQFMEEVIYDNVNVTKSERKKLKKGVNSKYKQVSQGTTTITNQGSSIDTPPKPTNPPADGKIYVLDLGMNQWVEVDDPKKP
jgi:hypothetical protein